MKIKYRKNQSIKCFTYVRELESKRTKCGTLVRYAEVICKVCNSRHRISMYSLSGNRSIKSCGCLTKKLIGEANTKHNENKIRLHRIWSNMKDRCNNNRRQYKDVTYCDEWDEYLVFKEWAINNGYNDNLSIDRINPYGNYEPDNCRWTTMTVQGANKKRLHSRNTSGFLGVTYEERSKKWVSQIEYKKDGKRVTKKIGRFTTKEEAAYARDKYIDENNLPHTKNFERIKYA
jgi:hypothetical protein